MRSLIQPRCFDKPTRSAAGALGVDEFAPDLVQTVVMAHKDVDKTGVEMACRVQSLVTVDDDFDRAIV